MGVVGIDVSSGLKTLPNVEVRSAESFGPVIRDAINNPIEVRDLISGNFSVDKKPGVLLENFSRQEARNFFQALTEESNLAVLEERAYHHPDSLIEHENQHIDKAEDLGVDLNGCEIRVLFTKDSESPVKQDDIQITFSAPKETDPFTLLEIGIAPDNMSDGDKVSFASTLRKNKLRLASDPSRTVDLLRRYKEKNGEYPKMW